ncbi:hypothetical protein JCM10908_001645 [Rhodotorula pacifica]|uniref:fungal specific transcription factor domain-containing protein n=1 Tax=Rhodotorula pacifica TaxID=1495444 RepID=UPI00316ED519
MTTSAEAAEVLRISQRASTSCSECSRRKTRWIRQAIAATPFPSTSASTSDPSMSQPAYQTSSSASSEPARESVPAPSLDTLALGAFSEVAEMRATIIALQDRLQGLEGILSGVFGRTKLEESSPQLQTMLPPTITHEPWLANLPADLQVVGNPAQQMPSASPYGPSGMVASAFSPPLSYGSSSLSSAALALPPLQGALATPPIAAMVNLPSDSAALEHTGAQADQSATQDPRWEKLREEEVAASLSLEFLALGRHRMENSAASPHQQLSSLPTTASIFDLAGFSPNPLAVYPSATALARILPPLSDCERIVSHTLDWTGWLHGSVHAPTFRAEVQEFWAAPVETRLEKANPAWLALFFAQLCCGLRHSTREQLEHLGPNGLSDEDVQVLSKAHFDAALACLYRSHFLDNRQLHAVQAVAVLVIGCQDGAFSNVFPSLLSLGIAMAQDLGFHRLPSDEAWAKSVADQSLEQRVQSLIAFETKKRVFWALTSEDWFSIHHRRMSTVQPTQVTTPLPSNAHDEDFLAGTIINRPPSEYTVTSKLLIWIQLARILQQAFQHLDDHPQPSYTFILELDKRMRTMLARMPSWLTSPEAPTANLPPNAAWVRNAFIISSNHKVLVLHRAFFLRYETSRRRAIEASRRILREAAHCGDTRMWTVPYHISAAASVICLDLFQRTSSPQTLRDERAEVEIGLATLRRMASFSGIASRGTALIQNLLEEEAKLPPIAVGAQEETRPGKRRRLSGEHANGRSPAMNGTSPHAKGAVTPQPGMPGTPSSFLPTVLLSTPSPSAATAQPAAPTPSSSDSFLNFATSSLMSTPPSTTTLTDSLPAEFVTAFLESGFDPLDGAITALQDFNWPLLVPQQAAAAQA